ncbi:unnamed protein product [Victoria cruziana]
MNCCPAKNELLPSLFSIVICSPSRHCHSLAVCFPSCYRNPSTRHLPTLPLAVLPFVIGIHSLATLPLAIGIHPHAVIPLAVGIHPLATVPLVAAHIAAAIPLVVILPLAAFPLCCIISVGTQRSDLWRQREREEVLLGWRSSLLSTSLHHCIVLTTDFSSAYCTWNVRHAFCHNKH